MTRSIERGPDRSNSDRRLASGGPIGREVAHDSYGPASAGYGDGHDSNVLLHSAWRLVRILLERRWAIGGVITLALVVGITVTILMTPLYTSTIRLQIDREPSKIVEGGSTTPSEAGANDFLRTQYELLKSTAMAERVVSQLQLHNDQDFLKPRRGSLFALLQAAWAAPSNNASTAVDRAAAAAAIVASTVVVRSVAGSRLVDVSYSDSNALRAQRIANAYGEASIASNIDKRLQSNSYAKSFLEDQTKQLKTRLEDSEREMLSYAEREKVLEVSERASIADGNLQAATAALGQIVADRIKGEQLWKQVDRATGLNLPQLLTNSVIEGLRVRRNALVSEYEEKLETFKPSYPSMLQIQAKIKEVDRQLAVEVQAIKASLKASYDAALAQEQELIQRLDRLREENLELQKKSIQYNVLKREVDTNRGLYLSLLQRYKEVDVAGGASANNIWVVDRAQLASAPSEPSPMRALLLSLMLGLGAGIGLAVLLDKLDDRITGPDELEQVSHLTMLGVIPVETSGRSFSEALLDPHSAVTEAYRSLATSLQFSTETGLPRSLSITSATPGEGKSSTALAIARHFATIGHKVLLIDADLREPSLHDSFGDANATGLADYLTGAVAPPDVIRSTAVSNLAFLPSGQLPPNAADLLGGTRMRSLVSVGLEVFDLIVIDCPPMLGLADAPLVCSTTAATLFVVGAGQTRKGMVISALRRLQLAKCRLVGVILTHYDPRTGGEAFGYGGHYGYGADVERLAAQRLTGGT